MTECRASWWLRRAGMEAKGRGASGHVLVMNNVYTERQKSAASASDVPAQWDNPQAAYTLSA
jgi:hypothetical protein